MSGSILNMAKRDAKKIVNQGGFQEDIILTSPSGTILAMTGIKTKHWINFDTDGMASNSKNAHICIDEDILTENNYPSRNSNGEVSLRGHKVAAKDSTGSNKTYVIKEWFPDETLGLIVCILGDYE